MVRTFVIVLGDNGGAFLDVDRVFTELGLDIQRVSYNKVVDVHMVFVDAEGPVSALDEAETQLREKGLFPDQAKIGSVQLVEFELDDAVGALQPVLELIDRFGFNITYVNAKVVDGARQVVQMGLYVEDAERLQAFLRQSSQARPTRLRAYDGTLQVLDNNQFYLTFVREMAQGFDLDEEQAKRILVNSNRIIQNLERTGTDPYKPFDYLRRFAQAILDNRGDAYERNTRVTRFETAGGVSCLLVEPPCGSDTWVLDCDDRYLVIDSGYACYREELLALLRRELPDWDQRRKELVLSHGDVDHAGCCDLFDHVWAVGRTMDNFRLELQGKPDWREQIPTHMPYVHITNILTGYEPPFLQDFTCLGRRPEGSDEPIARCVSMETGLPETLDVEPFHFEVWEGAGGHVRGETVLIDREQRICVSGDIFLNIHGETKRQHAFNMLAPYLMTSVDSVPDLEREERKYLFTLLDPGKWQLLGGHGALLEYTRS